MILVAAMTGACRRAPPSASPAPKIEPDSARATTTRFYASRRYGSEAELNPFSLLLNGGYDQLRTGTYRYVARVPYGTATRTILNSIVHPDVVLRQYGYGRWLRNEMFPLTTRGEGGGQWYPNYHLHLIAGGMTYARTVEWYEQHGVTGHPRLAAGITTYVWHFLNEVVENGDRKPYDEDGFTDLVFFDAASIVLWNQDWVTRQFGGRVEFTDWQGQASISFPGGTIENAYMLDMLRVPLPRSSDWKAMTTMGAAFLLGASRRVGDRYWVSAAGGFDPTDNPVVDQTTGRKTVTLQPNAGLFFDRDGSLLVALITKGGSNNAATLNMYPGVLSRYAGIWVQAVRGGGVRFGLVSRVGLGVGGFTRGSARNR
jgi:hypothetical protein